MLRKIAIATVSLLLALGVLLVAWYAIDGQPLAETEQFLSGDGFVASEGDDGSWIFRPAAPSRAGIVIMHGALIKPRSYAATAAFFARRGYTVLLPHGGFWRLPITAIERTAAMMAESPIDDWFLIGHSMGGMAALELLGQPGIKVRAVALWGAGMPFDFTAVDVPLLFLWGDADGILPAKRFETVKRNLPDTTHYRTIAGGNHRNFAMYSHQFFDRDGTLDWRAQTAVANELTAAFFAAETARQ